MADDRETGAEVARRVEQILEGAQRAAIEILREAQGRAETRERDLAERWAGVEGELRQLGRVADGLAAQVDALRRQIELIERELGEATQARPAASQPVSPPPAVFDLPEAADVRVERRADPRPARDPGSGDELSPERLVAMQMAAARCPRGEVEEHLRKRFGIADPSPILDDLYGREAV